MDKAKQLRHESRVLMHALTFRKIAPKPTPIIKVPNHEIRYGHTRSGDIETLWIRGRRSARMIHGIASTPAINRNKQSMSSSGCTARLPTPLFSEHASNANCIGEVISVRKSDHEIYVIAVINENGSAADHAWSLIQSGEVRAFSTAAVKGAEIDAVVDGVAFFRRWTLAEVSICRAGANADACFEIYNGVAR